MRKRGKFLVFEGADGAGKTSCVEYLKARLSGDVLFTKEPGGTEAGKAIKEVIRTKGLDPFTYLLLFLADRREHMKKVVIPALDAGRTVVADRFIGSTYAYQIVAGGLAEHEGLFWDMHRAILEAHEPDHTFYVTVSEDVARERLSKRARRHHFEEELEFQRKVREGYERFFARVPHTRLDGGTELSAMQEEALRLVRAQIGQ